MSKTSFDNRFDTLIINLKACFDEYLQKKSDIIICKKVFKELQTHVNNNNKDGLLKNKECACILRMIFFPFAVKLISENNLSSSFCIISIITWWLEKRNKDKVPSINLFNLLLERKVYSSEKINIKNSRDDTLGFSALEIHPHKSLKILIKLFEIKDSPSTECDNLVSLIINIVKTLLDEKKENFGLKYIFNDCDFKPLWKLYFDPLFIVQALAEKYTKDLSYIHTGKEKFIPTDASWIQVTWSDGRFDKYIKETQRERIDYIIDLYLEHFDWNERQNIIDQIKWDQIKFKTENIDLLSKKFLHLISYYF